MKVNKTLSRLSLFLLCVYLLLLATNFLSAESVDTPAKLFLTLTVLELFVFALPTVFYLRLSKNELLRKMHVTPLPKGSAYLIAASVLVILSIGLTLGTLFYFLGIGKESYPSLGPYILSSAPLNDNLVYALIAYGLIPALCEELFFRGILFAELEDYSPLAASLFSSLAFAFGYFDLSKVVIYLISGLLFTYILRLTKSLFVPIITRFFINVASIYLMPMLWRLLTQPLGVLFSVFVSIALFLLSLFFFLSALSRFYRHLSKDPARANDQREPIKEGFKKSAILFKTPFFLITLSISLAVMIITIFI